MPKSILRVTRTIVYYGDSDWINVTLARSLRVGEPLRCGTIPAGAGGRRIHVTNETTEVIVVGGDVEGKDTPNGA
jgi:hypothetical protein